ncbi:MAG: enoyl-CoA hydratase/isomerase family protein [Desulfurellaceae bacterium]|nr:enoyl-CoA hydratase/isomerase family protein [Desulfurellaceae bacterium]
MDTMQGEAVRYEQVGHIGWLRLNRADKLNAMTPQMWQELRELGQTLSTEAHARENQLRVLVVIGEGRAFSTGIDTSAFGGAAFNGHEREPVPEAVADDDPMVSIIQGFQEAFTWLEEAPYPTIAAVRGYALGAGMQMALACDIRVVARGSRLGLLEHRYGLIPDLGGTQRLPRLVGTGKAKELIFTAQQIEAEEAYRIGLAEQLVDDEALEATVTSLAEQLASQPPLAVRAAKRAIDASPYLSVRDGLLLEAKSQAVCIRSQDAKEAVRAFMEKRMPQYSGK